MHTTIQATHIELTDAIQTYAEEKVAMLEKLMDATDTTIRADIEVGTTSTHHKSGDIFRAEINLHVGGELFRAVSKQEDLYAAIDAAKDEVADQLRSHKGKNETLDRKAGAAFKEDMHTEAEL